MQARAGAMDELLASGALTDLTQPVDDIQAQLDQLSTTSAVDNELAALKAEVGAGAPAGELPSGAAEDPGAPAPASAPAAAQPAAVPPGADQSDSTGGTGGTPS
jgi:phage shock protein A